jgi:hypothetical protein
MDPSPAEVQQVTQPLKELRNQPELLGERPFPLSERAARILQPTALPPGANVRAVSDWRPWHCGKPRSSCLRAAQARKNSQLSGGLLQ